MTAPHYYASTDRILIDPLFKYGLFQAAYQVSLAQTGKHMVSMRRARWICTAAAAMITTAFFGLEANLIDDSARKAVAAELGIDPKEIVFSDYKYSKNAIAHKAHEDLVGLQKYRYGTDLMFLLPSVVDTLCGTRDTASNMVRRATDERTDDFTKFTWIERLVKGSNGLDMAVYAGKGAYWTAETYLVQKTAYYEIVKLRELLESTGKNMRPDDLMAVYQRTRTDKKLDMVRLDDKPAYDALAPLFKRMSDAYNQHDGKFGIAEIIYLIGMDKIKIHEADNKTLSPAAVEASNKELDRVLRIGLDGIREENRALNQTRGSQRQAGSFLDQLTNGAVKTLGSGLKWMNLTPKRSEETISRRDPSELIGFNGITR